MNGVRLLPLVLVAASALLLLRGMSILSDGRLNAFGTSAGFAQQQTQAPAAAAARTVGDENVDTNAPNETQSQGTEETTAPLNANGEATANVQNGATSGVDVNFSPRELQALQQSGMSENEIQLLLRLRERREQLESRERQLELRENMLKNVETSLQTKLDALGGEDGTLNGRLDENGQLIEDNAHMERLASMYSSMKPKDAARIMSRLSTPLLAELARTMSPRKMSAIMAQMSNDAAERLTLALANSSRPTQGQALPQIGPTGLSN